MNGSYSTQAPFLCSRFFLRWLFIVLLIDLTWPLAFGFRGQENVLLIFSWSQISFTRALSNCLPFSVTIKAGIPCRHMIFFHMKFLIFASVILARDSTSTHLLMISTPHLAKGHCWCRFQQSQIIIWHIFDLFIYGFQKTSYKKQKKFKRKWIEMNINTRSYY